MSFQTFDLIKTRFILFSFLIGGDDNYYEGAGWNYAVKDIHQEPSKEDDSPGIIFAYISREEGGYIR